MGDVSAEPSMEDILASIKRIIAEDADNGAPVRARRRPPAPVAIDEHEDEVLELSEPAPEPVHFQPEASTPAPMPMSPPAPPANEPIVSAQAAEASRAPLDTLSKLVVKPETTGSDTLEGMVREMLRPMLRDWLDRNLPAMVEGMVAKEIARISGDR